MLDEDAPTVVGERVLEHVVDLHVAEGTRLGELLELAVDPPPRPLAGAQVEIRGALGDHAGEQGVEVRHGATPREALRLLGRLGVVLDRLPRRLSLRGRRGGLRRLLPPALDADRLAHDAVEEARIDLNGPDLEARQAFADVGERVGRRVVDEPEREGVALGIERQDPVAHDELRRQEPEDLRERLDALGVDARHLEEVRGRLQAPGERPRDLEPKPGAAWKRPRNVSASKRTATEAPSAWTVAARGADRRRPISPKPIGAS